MRPLIIYKPNDHNHKFHLLIDVPEEPLMGKCSSEPIPNCYEINDNCICAKTWKPYEEQFAKCKESSIGIENPEIIEEELGYFKCLELKENETFPLPENLEFEIGYDVCEDCPYKKMPCIEGCSKRTARLRLKESKVEDIQDEILNEAGVRIFGTQKERIREAMSLYSTLKLNEFKEKLKALVTEEMYDNPDDACETDINNSLRTVINLIDTIKL